MATGVSLASAEVMVPLHPGLRVAGGIKALNDERPTVLRRFEGLPIIDQASEGAKLLEHPEQ